MAQRKPDAERSKRRGSEKRQRQKIVAVRFTPAERAALAAASECTAKGASTLLREAFLVMVSDGAYPPSAAQVRAWLRGHGWTAEPAGAAGAIWHTEACSMTGWPFLMMTATTGSPGARCSG